MNNCIVSFCSRIISNLEENEAKMQTELKLQREFKDKIALLSVSYVEDLDEDYLFQQMFSSDEGRFMCLISTVYIYIHNLFKCIDANIAGRALSTINEDTQHAFEEYKESFITICHELYELGLRENEKRTEEMRLFEVAVNKGKENMQNEARR